jgi:hypothetical protein
MPDRRFAVPAAALVFVALAAAPEARAQFNHHLYGTLDAGDAAWTRPEGSGSSCSISTSGTSVRYQAHELILPEQPPVLLTASSCFSSSLDTVLLVYQRLDREPAAFNPATPCVNLQAFADDSCGEQSEIPDRSLLNGHAVVVVTLSDNADPGGDYQINLEALGLDDFIFYSGFEVLGYNTWSSVSP